MAVVLTWHNSKGMCANGDLLPLDQYKGLRMVFYQLFTGPLPSRASPPTQSKDVVRASMSPPSSPPQPMATSINPQAC